MTVATTDEVMAPAEFERCPHIQTEEVNSCPLCGGGRHSEFAIGFDYELRTCRNAWHFVACASCSHVWLNPRPATAELPVIYPPHYYAYNYQSVVHPIAAWAKGVLDHGKLKGILRYCSGAPKSYLDAGCGDGRFLRAMAARGVPRSEIHGLELDERVVAHLRAEGFQAFCERVEDCRLPAESIDLATMFHVIEHVDDPGAVVRGVRRCLKPGGIFAIETPNVDSWDARLFHERYWGGYHIPRHWNLFSPQTLKRLLEQNGFEVLATEYKTGHSFWMYSLHHWLRYHGVPWPKLAQRFDPMGSLAALACFTGFDILRKSAGFRTSAMLLVARKRA